MKTVLVVGSGSREHALAWKLAESPEVGCLIVAPGNGGTAGDKLESANVALTDHQGMIALAKERSVDFVVIGPDDQLAAGMADDFKAASFPVFGCTQAAAQIESSKAFAKDLMKKKNIPTAPYERFTDLEAAKTYVSQGKFPVVIKASGLALGKGVCICADETEAHTALVEIMADKKFGDSGKEVVIEDFLEGTELSTHAFCDGNTAVLFPPSQDYKQVYDGGTGPNTGGMGVVAPLPWVSEELMQKVQAEIVDPVLKALDESGALFQGLLYPGLMEKDGGLNVVEFNARFGQPECECYMRILNTDLFKIMRACVDGKLSELAVNWSGKYVAGVFLVSEGYPESYEKGLVITGIDEAEKDSDVVVFHAGTKRDGDQIVTSGGRVLNVTATADTLEAAIEKAYAACEKINFDGKYMRTDIGSNTLNKSS